MEKDQQVISTEPRRPSSSVDSGLENNRRSTIVVESKWEPGSVLPSKRRAGIFTSLENQRSQYVLTRIDFGNDSHGSASVLW